jgi:hypothetical protein
MTWNYNMDEAPHGRTERREDKRLKGSFIHEVFIPDRIIAAENGNTNIVTLSHWIPNENRWHMFAKGETPFAWMPWPEHPQSNTDKKEPVK